MIELIHVKKQFAQSTPLKDVNVTINKGDVISVIGPSGTGKSTLLRCINMLAPPTDGQIIVDGEDITAPKCNLSKIRQKIGMVFQSFNLFDNMTVIENIMTPQIDLLKRSERDAFEKGMELLKKVGMEGRYLQYPEQLSGGQKQRVAIARTLAMDPEAILFDEPTSALDPSMVDEVKSVIGSLAKSGITMMIVTHEMNFARKICNWVFYMDQGGIYEDGPPEQIFEHPQRERTKAFIQHLKVCRYKCLKSQFDNSVCDENINNFLQNNPVSIESRVKLEAILSRIKTDFVPSFAAADSMINLIVEYSEENESVKLLLYCTPSVNEASVKSYFEKENSIAAVEQITDNDYTTKITCSL